MYLWYELYLFGIIKWVIKVKLYEIFEWRWENSYLINNLLNIYEIIIWLFILNDVVCCVERNI